MLQPTEGIEVNQDELSNHRGEKENMEFEQEGVGKEVPDKMAEEGMELADEKLNSAKNFAFETEHKNNEKTPFEQDENKNKETKIQTPKVYTLSGNQDLNLRKSSSNNEEIEDEHQIRIATPVNSNQAKNNNVIQQDSKFDVSDMSFFDTPVHKQTHSTIRNINSDNDKTVDTQTNMPIPSFKIACDEEKPPERGGKTKKELNDNTEYKYTEEVSPENCTANLVEGSNKIYLEKMSDNTLNDLEDVTKLNKFQNLIQNSKEYTIEDVKSSALLGKAETEDNAVETNGQNIISPNFRNQASGDNLQINSDTLPSESSVNDINETVQNLSNISKVIDFKTEVAHYEENSKQREDILERNASKLSSSTFKYEEDFETEDHVEELEKLRTSSKSNGKDYKDEARTLNEETSVEKTRTAETMKEYNGQSLMVVELSDSDIFSREKTKSSIPRIPKKSQETQMQPKHEVHNDNDITAGKAQSPGFTEVKTFTREPTEAETSLTKEAQIIDGQQYLAQKESSDSEKQHAVRSKNNNPYFTGRLPSLGVEDDYITKEESRGINDEQEKNEGKYIKLPDIMPDDKDEPETVSEHRSTSRILELIQEINAPAQRFQITKERPLTPKTPSDKRAIHPNDETSLPNTEISKTSNYKEAPDRNNEIFLTGTEVPITPEQAKNDNKNDEAYGVENTKMTIGDVDLLTSSIMNEYVRHEAPASAKFDSFPHIKQISEYKKVNKLAETPRDVYENSMQRDQKQQETQQPNEPKQMCSREKSHESEKHTVESSTVIANDIKESSENDIDNITHPNKRSSSENELKAVVASAKRAFGQDTTASSSSVLPPLTREATLESEIATIKQDKDESTTSLQTSRLTDDSSHVLICSNCLNQDSNIESAGFCRECQQYLCGNCISLHKKSSYTKRHEIMSAYCVKELEVKKYVKATGYCIDCQHFLCMKCVIRHTGFRANRHHRIIQRTFLSKPSKKSNRASRTGVHVSFEQNTKVAKYVRSQREKNKLQAREKLLKDIDQGNPYRVNFVNVPQSLYPGPNKKLAMSYADNPKWPQASVPKMPYLVKPKSLQERLLQTPYVAHRKSALYTDTKSAFDPKRIKLKMLQDQFGSKSGINRPTGRRKEEGLFTARREKKSDVTSLPNIDTKQTKAHVQKNEKCVPKPSELKRVKFLKEHCVSVPFPSGERHADILAMACLPNSSILIADRQNNNVKLYSKHFKFKAIVQFNNRLADLCASNLCPVDVYVATQKHVFEITTMKKGLEVQRKMKVDIKRIEGITCWKYGIALIHKKTNLTWEVKLMDYRGNSKSKLEIVNPFTQEIDEAPICYTTSIKGGKRVILTDTRNACIICTDVTSRCVLYETTLPENCTPSYVTSDNQHNVYISCVDKIQQLSKEGNNLGAVITKPDGVKSFGCVLYNRSNDLLYVQTSRDTVSVYQVF